MQSHRNPKDSEFTYFMKNFGAGVAAAFVAEIATMPIDTAKVRLQVQTKALEGPLKYSGFLGTCATISREEGVHALYNGLTAGL